MKTDGRIGIGPAPLRVRLAKRGSLTVAVPRKRIPPLTEDVVKRTLDSLRRRGGGARE
jgi:hypothetical protein